MQTLLDEYNSGTVNPTTNLNPFEANYADIAQKYYDASSTVTLGEAAVYALLTIFGDSIKVYEAPRGSPTYVPLTITTNADGSKTISQLPCPTK